MKRFALLLTIACCASQLFGQAAATRVIDSGTLLSGATFTHVNTVAELNHSAEYVISGAPTSVSITLSGCMRGGTCQALSMYQQTTNTVVSVTGLFDSYTITPTFTGGTNPSLTVNWLATAASAPSYNQADQCQNISAAKKVKSVDISSAGTTVIVSGVVGQSLSLCGFVITMTGTTTADTVKLVTGTGSCAGPTDRTATFNSGVLSGGGATVISFNPGVAMFATATNPAVALCATTTIASSPTINVTVTYVQL